MWKFKEIIRDKYFWKSSWVLPGALFGIATTLLTFIEFDTKIHKLYILIALVCISVLYIIIKLAISLRLSKISLNIDGSEVEIKKGDIFKASRDAFKVIAFNEFFDTLVDDKIISKTSLNGQYIEKYYQNTFDLDKRIKEDKRMYNKITEEKVNRPLGGKTTRYKLGSVYLDDDFFLLAFSKFDDNNKANLKLQEYANCLMNFWNEVNNLYAQKEVFVPLLGTGITTHKDFDATPHQLLEVMLWTFKISKVKFKEPSKITILIDESKLNKINFYKIKEIEKNDI